MAQFVKAGTCLVNIDNILFMEDLGRPEDGRLVRVWFAAGSLRDKDGSRDFHGDAAERLLNVSTMTSSQFGH